MLIAATSTGDRIYAGDAQRTDSCQCPECARPVILKAGQVKIAHFAHVPGSVCRYGEGESVRHREMKVQIVNLFSRFDPQLEVRFGIDRRADVVARDVVIECQASAISVEEWNERTRFYNRAGFAVLWVWDEGRIGGCEPRPDGKPTHERRIPAEIRKAHQFTYGRVYVLDQFGDLWSCHLHDADTRYSEWYDEWGEYHDSAYQPKTLRRPGFFETPLQLLTGHGPMGHNLGFLGDRDWWNRQEAA